MGRNSLDENRKLVKKKEREYVKYCLNAYFYQIRTIPKISYTFAAGFDKKLVVVVVGRKDVVEGRRRKVLVRR